LGQAAGAHGLCSSQNRGKHKVLKAQENLHGQTNQFIAESTSLSPLNRIEANSAFGF